jgi:hypothetical protein
VNDADRKIKTLYEQVRPETIEAAVAEARKLAPDLTDEGRRLLEVLLAMQQGLQLAAGRLAKRRASDARNGPWGLAVALSVVGLAVAALVERILASEGPRRWSQGAMSMVAFVLVTGGLFITTRWYLRGRRLRDRR